MKTHTITLDELFKFQQNEKIIYASSSKENKILYLTLRGSYEIWHNNKLIKETIQPYTAVETYNNITN